MWSDDGIALRLPDADAPPPLELIAIAPDELDDLLVERVASSPLFAGRFRENAARALLIPRRRPGQRTPLWQQRLKAHDLQQVAVKHGSFPIVLETYRELLVRRLRGARAARPAGSGSAAARCGWSRSSPARPSPFATSLLFDYIATYMYEGDAPVAERRAQALQLDRALLGRAALRRRPARAAGRRRDRRGRVRAAAAAPAGGRPTTTTTGCAGWATWRRPTCPHARAAGPRAARGGRPDRRPGAADRRRGRRRSTGTASAPRSRPGCRPPSSIRSTGALERLVARHAADARAVHGRASCAARLGVDPLPALEALAARGELLRGAFRPGGAAEEWVAPDVLRRVRRRTLAHLRREVEPVDRDALVRFLPTWHGIGRDLGRGAGPRARGDLAAGRRGVAGDRPGSRTCCRCACPGTGRPTWTRCAPPARRCGSAPARPRRAGAARGRAVPAHRRSGGPRAPGAGAAARGLSGRARCSSATCRRELGGTERELLAASGSWPGPAW